MKHVVFLAAVLVAVSAAPTHPSFLVLLGDDIGWADLSYNGGHALTPNLDALAHADGSILFNDFHSGGTVCSPTRASILTGRNPFRDGVNLVYGCSDMTECVPHFVFAPNHTFTAPMAVQAANDDYTSFFAGKWHLGSLYNDSELYGGLTSSPATHGFDFFNATVEVAPTMTTNCNCNNAWAKDCQYGHDEKATHCSGHKLPYTGNNCCFNYWVNDENAVHGVTNYTDETPADDTEYLTEAFDVFLDEHAVDKPFFAQISFHNCHIPFIGSSYWRGECAAGRSCLNSTTPYTDAQLDFYACLNMLDAAVGRVLESLESRNRRQDTMLWFTTDNGPEGHSNCTDGRCTPPFTAFPGSAGPLRGRKRSVWEGGHRVPGIVSFPAMVSGNIRSNDTINTDDILPTIMEILDVKRPASQADWGFDGSSIVPVLKGGRMPARSLGWLFDVNDPTSNVGLGYRYHDPASPHSWKLVYNDKYCALPTCAQPQLYDLNTDIAEAHNLAEQYPDILQGMIANFSTWYESVYNSRVNEQNITDKWYPNPLASMLL